MEGTIEYYWALREYYHDGTINSKKYPGRIMLLSYALSQQAKFGDLPWSTPKPPAWNIKASYMYGAWEKQKGRARTDARKDFIQLTEAILAVQGDD